MNDPGTPPGVYELIIECSNCGQQMQTTTEANMSDPEQAEFVKRMAKMFLCQTCYGHVNECRRRDRR